MMHHWGHGMHGGGFGIIFIILAVIVIYGLIRIFNSNNTNYKEDTKALDILNERFAKGEIGEEEYERKKDLILRK